LIERLDPPYRISPASEHVALGHFLREGRRILLLANVSRGPYRGRLETGGSGPWQMMDPATGKIRPAAADPAGRLRVELAGRQAILLVRPQPTPR